MVFVILFLSLAVKLSSFIQHLSALSKSAIKPYSNILISGSLFFTNSLFKTVCEILYESEHSVNIHFPRSVYIMYVLFGLWYNTIWQCFSSPLTKVPFHCIWNHFHSFLFKNNSLWSSLRSLAFKFKALFLVIVVYLNPCLVVHLLFRIHSLWKCFSSIVFWPFPD